MPELPTTRPLDLSNPRYWQQNANLAVRDIFDALTELITNADDAYSRARTSGRIEIEVERRRKGTPSIIRVRDFASGLTHDEMNRKIGRVGNRRDSGLPAGAVVRGTNSRGAKDVAALGPVTYESIGPDGRYARCGITPKGEFQEWPDGPASGLVREPMGIRKGTGTVVTIEVDPAFQIPLHGNLKSKLAQLVPLREVLVDPNRQVFLRDLTQDRADQVHAPSLIGVDRVKETFSIPGYPQAQAKLIIKRAAKPLENRGKFREGGILILSRKAVHESTLFAPEFEHDPHAALFFGRLRCEYIDDLWNESDERMERDLPPDPKNPFPILDSLRQAGLRRDHPFFQALQREVLKRLRPLIEEERRQEAAKRAQIENRETRRRLNDLEKLATEFMREQQEDMQDDLDNRLDTDLPKGSRDVLLSPPFAQMIVGQTRRFSLTVNQEKRPELAVGSMVQIECETSDISTDKVSCPLESHPTTEGLLRVVWEVKAVHVTSATGLVVRCGSVVATSTIEILASERDLYSDVLELQFQRKRYRLRPNQPKRVRLFAPYPGTIGQPTAVVFTCDRPEVKITGDHVLHPREYLGIADCRIAVTCAQPDLKAVLTAEVGTQKACTELLCGPPEGDAIKIELMDVDYTNQRYYWQKGTNKLIIAARHPSLRRYLGPANAQFPGQDKIQFQVLLAEIVAFAVAEKVLERRVAQDPDAYRDADVVTYFAERDELVTRFLPLAHESQVPKPL
ncbi:MAG: hypothetical protein WD042_06380 [Phycisphaeraceae bacterium]